MFPTLKPLHGPQPYFLPQCLLGGLGYCEKCSSLSVLSIYSLMGSKTILPTIPFWFVVYFMPTSSGTG